MGTETLEKFLKGIGTGRNESFEEPQMPAPDENYAKNVGVSEHVKEDYASLAADLYTGMVSKVDEEILERVKALGRAAAVGDFYGLQDASRTARAGLGVLVAEQCEDDGGTAALFERAMAEYGRRE